MQCPNNACSRSNFFITWYVQAVRLIFSDIELLICRAAFQVIVLLLLSPFGVRFSRAERVKISGEEPAVSLRNKGVGEEVLGPVCTQAAVVIENEEQ